MKLIYDKFIDGLFIFVGVYIAFWFDQYQEDMALKRELNIHMTEIIRDLPNEEPKTKIRPFKFEQQKTPDGKCGRPLFFIFDSDGGGQVYLDVIQKRGLGRYIKDDSIVPLLSLYYNELVPKQKAASDQFYNKLNELAEDYYNLKTKECLKKNEVSEIEMLATRLYMKMHLAKGVAQKMGYQVLQKILQQGFTKPPVRSLDFNYSIEITDDDGDEEQEKSTK